MLKRKCFLKNPKGTEYVSVYQPVTRHPQRPGSLSTNPNAIGMGGGGVLAAVFERLRDRGLVASDTEIAMLDSTSVKVHADGTGGSLKKRSAKYRTLARRADDQDSSTGVGRSSGVEFLPRGSTTGHRHDAPESRQLLQKSSLKHTRSII